MTFLTVTLVVIALLVVGSLVWRWAKWPCPSWLVPLLENPYFETVAGAELLLSRAGVRTGMCVLDAGSGPGRVTLPAASRVGPSGRVVALDLQDAMLDRLRARLQARGVTNAEPIAAGLGEGRLGEDRFDVALLVTVLGEVPDKLAAFHEIARALRPGGVLSVTEVLPDPHYQSVAQVRALAATVGLVEGAIHRGWLSYTINLVRPVE